MGRRGLNSSFIFELMGLLAQPRKRTSNNHRGHLDIIADILCASQGGIKKTYIMYHCNLSFRQLKHYLNFLLSKELLCVVAKDTKSEHGMFEITEKGKEFLKAYSGLKTLLG